jgi:hypothetical protein
MTDMSKEVTAQSVMKLALEALESWRKGFPDNWSDLDTEAVTALQEALASEATEQPAQRELVGWLTRARYFVNLYEFTEAEAKLHGWNAVYVSLGSEQPAQQESVVKKKHDPKIDLGKYAGTYGGYITPEPSEGYLEKAYRLANKLRSHLSIAPPQRKPLTDEQRLDVMTEFEKHRMKWDDISILIDMVEAAHDIKENT